MTSFIDIPGGVIELGLSDDEREKTHSEDLSLDLTFEAARGRTSMAGFRIQKEPVTNAEYLAFVEARGYDNDDLWKEMAAHEEGGLDRRAELVDQTDTPGPLTWRDGRPPAHRLDHPVSGVSFYEACAYAAFHQHRLPTDAEWEYVARNGDRRTLFPWGDDFDAEACVFARSHEEGTASVGSHPRGNNRWGVVDLSGNVAEWVSDRGSAEEDAADYATRVVRGSFYSTRRTLVLRSTTRTPHSPTTRSPGFGFRLAASAKLNIPLRI